MTTTALFGREAKRNERAAAGAVRASRDVFNRSRLPFAGLRWALPLPAGRRYLAARSGLDATLDGAFAARRAAGPDEDLVSGLADAQDKADGAMTDRDIRADGWTYLAQGAQATTLIWTWHVLAKYPSATGTTR